MYSVHHQFFAITQTGRMVDRTGEPVEEITGIAEEREVLVHRLGLCSMSRDERSSQNVARQFLITSSKQLEQNKNANFYNKNYGVSKKDFRQVHQQNFIEMEEVRKFQICTFDDLTRKKFIEDQNTIMELSGRLQELQNEVNCMNDSQDAESVRSGNSLVTRSTRIIPWTSCHQEKAFIRIDATGPPIFGIHPAYQKTFL